MPAIQFSEHSDISDLISYLERARKLDPDGLVKFKSFGAVLAVYVAPIFSANLLGDGPTVLGLRTLQLENPLELDLNFELSAILERLAGVGEDRSLSLPPVQQRAAWTGVTPPREGWEAAGQIPQQQLTLWAKDGISEVASLLPENIGASIAQRVRAQVWGKRIGYDVEFPAAAAFALAGLGFMSQGEMVSVYQTRGWVRLSTKYGHVLARQTAA